MSRVGAAGAAIVAALLLSTSAAQAANRRVVVGGRPEDPLSARVQKELLAMGFEVVRVDAAEGCARSAVSQRIREAAAHAATCTDGDAIGVWIVEPTGMRLRDVVVARTPDEQQRDMAAVRAAEIARASLELVDAEGEAPKAKPAATPPKAPGEPPPFTLVSDARDPDRAAAPPKPKDTKRAPTFVGGVGLSTLMGVDASVAALSMNAEVGILRWLSVGPRLDYPIEAHDVGSSFTSFGGGGAVKVRPGFAGATASVPLARPSAFVIPRFGAGLGFAWIQGETSEGFGTAFGADGSFTQFPTTRGGTDWTWSPAVFGSAALSMRIAGPVRMTVDGSLGTTVSRMVVRTQNIDRAYWGTPFGALALRMELLFR